LRICAATKRDGLVGQNQMENGRKRGELKATKAWGACACGCGGSIKVGDSFVMLAGDFFLAGHERRGVREETRNSKRGDGKGKRKLRISAEQVDLFEGK